MNIIGTGKLGRTLAKLFSDAGLLTIGAIYNRNIQNSESAQAFIGAGHVTAHFKQLSNTPADLWMIATPDDALSTCAKQLAELTHLSWQNTLVFHSSGLKTSTELAPLHKLGSAIASAHPAHSFASPERSLRSFCSTVCTLEGDDRAINTLAPLFNALGCKVTTLQPETKPLYHAATVMASNYLIALMAASETLLKKAGIEDNLASDILEPLMRQSLENGLQVGPVDALTGPIARGDITTLQAHITAIEAMAPDLLSSYTSMGMQTLKLAQKKDSLAPEKLAPIAKILSKQPI